MENCGKPRLSWYAKSSNLKYVCWPGNYGNGHPFSMFSNRIYALFAYSCFAYSCFAYSRFAYFIPKSGISPATFLTVLCTVLNINTVLNIQYNINTKTCKHDQPILSLPTLCHQEIFAQCSQCPLTTKVDNIALDMAFLNTKLGHSNPPF